jgi:hypothetical protein
VVDSIRYKKGAYYAEEGDFSAAGAADIRYVDTLERGILHAAPGTEGYRRFVAADSFAFGSGALLGAVEYNENDGPWERPDDFRKVNGLLRWSRGDAANGLTVTAMGYDGRWSSTDQIPERAVERGLIGRFGSLDPTDGGSSHRYSLAAELRRGSERSLSRVQAYLLDYRLDLFSNFTYFLDDPENGDQFEQVDDRVVAGIAAERQWLSTWRGRDVEATVGFQARGDEIANGLYSTRARRRLATTREDDVLQWTAGPYAQARVTWTPWLRTVAGLRADYFWADVESNVPDNSGTEDDVLLSPKLSFLFGPWRRSKSARVGTPSSPGCGRSRPPHLWDKIGSRVVCLCHDNDHRQGRSRGYPRRGAQAARSRRWYGARDGHRGLCHTPRPVGGGPRACPARRALGRPPPGCGGGAC